jgi:hypothetical protein
MSRILLCSISFSNDFTSAPSAKSPLELVRYPMLTQCQSLLPGSVIFKVYGSASEYSVST